MRIRTVLLATTIVSVLASAATAQQMPMTSSSSVQMANSLPEACRNSAQVAGTPRMQDMQGMMGQMTETQKGLHEAMMKMEPAMMMGMMNKDADVAWICAMIPHHQGAIDMARAGLRGADNAESRRMAEETIQMQEKEIAKLTAWVEKNGVLESKNETTGSTVPPR